MILVNAGLSPAVPKFLQNVSACALAWETYEADLSVKLEMVSPEGDYATNTMGKGSIRQLEAGFASIPVSDGQHGSETAAQVIGGACSTTPNCVYGAFITSAVPCCREHERARLHTKLVYACDRGHHVHAGTSS
jgi:hypothetical protein